MHIDSLGSHMRLPLGYPNPFLMLTSFNLSLSTIPINTETVTLKPKSMA